MLAKASTNLRLGLSTGLWRREGTEEKGTGLGPGALQSDLLGSEPVTWT